VVDGFGFLHEGRSGVEAAGEEAESALLDLQSSLERCAAARAYEIGHLELKKNTT